MFTGLVEEVGEIAALSESSEFRTIRVRARLVLEDMRSGSSIAVNGVCLTATRAGAGAFTADLSHETLARTTLGALVPGTLVNLERPMRADGRFGGHIVQGHVDGIGRIHRFERQGDNWNLEIVYPASGAGYIVEKGSIAVNGISLTVAGLGRTGTFSVAVIPYTFENTNLKAAKAGDPVNLEFDIVAKYVENLCRRAQA
jgi:riboflavin synthase